MNIKIQYSYWGEFAGWQQWIGGGLVISGMILIGTGSVPARVCQKSLTIDKITSVS